MSLATSQDVLVHIAKALSPVTEYLRPMVPDNWAFVPVFMIFFIQLFSISMLWIRYVNVSGKKAPFLGSCVMSRSVAFAGHAPAFYFLQIFPSICTANNVILLRHIITVYMPRYAFSLGTWNSASGNNHSTSTTPIHQYKLSNLISH